MTETYDKALSTLDRLTGRLVAKMHLSQTPVPGFIVGLSGSDSVVAFEVLARGLAAMGMPDRLLGIHYASERRRGPGTFERDTVPWLRERHPAATILVETPLGGNQDAQRWADLHLRALNAFVWDGDGRRTFRALPEGRNWWTVGCTNLTEHELGKYSMMSREVSIQPIRTIRKTMVIRICEAIGTPATLVESSRLPDCVCGREEIAASNIETIDDILSGDLVVTDHDPALLDQLFAWIKETKAANAFKQRTPYLI